ncbi:DEAD/DEAH box helicase family protein [Aquibacillus rhizosphaerae]|uniref:DEAD/DEAH box helicase family protein n=1 Tax=Aquibacillus rhizosphaerae TaxID=3051431 RepID=A0ABT7L7A6_9BACI|nr:DEAD/DEAH box helicase family protein [Aquibacillus sp. LR5S19]MDL4841726.1 DEAD/DEAH box helicase family protein [Aquibacillus sp. LR5S19]
MDRFPENISFFHPFRSYQREVLQHLDSHLENKHLHLVAPPGSGKTVLGLEVMLRLNKSALIVAPTLAIRNQWVTRFTELFLQTDKLPSWITTDIRNPQFITVTTYQSLHALFKDDLSKEAKLEVIDDEIEEDESIMELTEKEQARERLFKQKFQTLLLDEAHHLRTSWWKTTIAVRDQLTNPTVVALTATPPYDVGKSEWDKYIELCGPIDEEIDVAALVKEGDLCPHQDYLWISMPTHKEKEPIDIFHMEAEQLKVSLLKNEAFKALIESHPWMKTEDYIEEKLANHSYFISMISYLKETESEAWQMPFQLVDEKAKHLPSFNLEWAEELLTAMFYRDKHLNPKEEPLKSIKQQLSSMRALEHRRVKLVATRSMERTLLQSASKLDSITQIVSLEKQAQKEALRLVILADYIYAEDLPNHADDEKPLIRLGVIPVFEKIRRELGESCKLGVLTGSVVILPKETVSLLEEYSLDYHVDALSHDDRYVTIKTKGASKQYIVRCVTEIFSRGDVDVLIGTTALLGEGWDAPSVNTLVLASYVGTFMLTNQMRGRAIRTEQGNPNKVANIWHLVCVDEKAYDGGYDFHSLRRRFRSLTGLDEELPLITSGLERLRLPNSNFSSKTVSSINNTMYRKATNRERLFERWQEAVHKGEEKREEIQTDQSVVPRPFVFRNTLKSLLVISLVLLLNILYSIGESGYYYSFRELLFQMLFGLAIGVLLSSPFWWKALRIFLFNSSIESSMEQVGNSIYHTLFQIGQIQTAPTHNKVHAKKEKDGRVVCYLECGTTHEQKLFLQSLQEIVDPIDNPRYLLHRKSGKRFWVRHDYHAVPEEIGRKKEFVETLLAHWKKRVGDAELVYVHTPEGRKMLLKARMRAMSSKFVKKSERINVWR